MVTYWKISAGRNAIFINIFKNNNFIALGEYKEGDLTQYTSAEEIKDEINHRTRVKRPHVSKYCYDFANVLDIDDIVVVYNRSTIKLVGKVVSKYYYRSDGKGTPVYRDGLPHRRDVKWILPRPEKQNRFRALGRKRFAFFELVGNDRTIVLNFLQQQGLVP